MPTTAATITGTGASLAGIGTVVWATPENITASDDTRATAAITGSATSRWLVATNFGLSIPADAVVLGVTGTVEASYASGTSTQITAASFVVGDAVVGTQKTLTTALTTSDANYTVGSASDLWGYAITPALLNTSTTGFAISMTGVGIGNSGRVDAMWITVDYGYNGFRNRVTSSTLSNRLRRPLMSVRS